MLRSGPTILALLSAFLVCFPARYLAAEEQASPAPIRVEWAPRLSVGGFVFVKGNEGVPLGEAMSDGAPIRRMFENCSECRPKLEASRKNGRRAAVLGGLALGGIVGGLVLFSANEKVGFFLPLAVTVTGYGLLFSSAGQARNAQQDLFDAVRIYNAQIP